jgi:hypothetical protein
VQRRRDVAPGKQRADGAEQDLAALAALDPLVGVQHGEAERLEDLRHGLPPPVLHSRSSRLHDG